MKEYRRDIAHSPDREYWFVELGPILGFPAWHEASKPASYPFPTLAAATLFANTHRGMYGDREVKITYEGETVG